MAGTELTSTDQTHRQPCSALSKENVKRMWSLYIIRGGRCGAKGWCKSDLPALLMWLSSSRSCPHILHHHLASCVSTRSSILNVIIAALYDLWRWTPAGGCPKANCVPVQPCAIQSHCWWSTRKQGNARSLTRLISFLIITASLSGPVWEWSLQVLFLTRSMNIQLMSTQTTVTLNFFSDNTFRFVDSNPTCIVDLNMTTSVTSGPTFLHVWQFSLYLFVSLNRLRFLFELLLGYYRT
jgi:hypothetical protein